MHRFRRRLLLLLATTIACTAALCLENAAGTSPPAAAATQTYLDYLNQIRLADGLAGVTENSAWVTGIQHHLTYLANTDPSLMTGPYASAHSENPASPYYTADGASEAAASNLLVGATSSDIEAIDIWLGAPFHASAMLDPGLQQVALARDSGGAGLDVLSGRVPAPISKPILFPPNGTTTKLSSFHGEDPDPTETCLHTKPGADYHAPGLPLFAMLPQAPASALSATLKAPDGTTVSTAGSDLCLVDASDYVTSDPVYGSAGLAALQDHHMVILIPRTVLYTGMWTATLTQSGQPDISWSFYVQGPKLQPPSAHVGIVHCSASAVGTGSTHVTITNLMDSAGPASYTIQLAGLTFTTPVIADGATAVVALTNLPAGALNATITGSDGSANTFLVRVATCPASHEVTVHFGSINRHHRQRITLDNSLNATTTAFRIVVNGTASKVKVAAESSARTRVRLAAHHRSKVKVLVGGHVVARELAGP